MLSNYLHNLQRPNGVTCAFAPITRETRYLDPTTTLCGRRSTGAWGTTEDRVDCPDCVALVDAAHELALHSTLLTFRSRIKPQFVKEGDLIEDYGCVYRVDDEPLIDDCDAIIPVDVFGWANCVELPASGWVTLVMQELVPTDLDEADDVLAVAA